MTIYSSFLTLAQYNITDNAAKRDYITFFERRERRKIILLIFLNERIQLPTHFDEIN